MATQQSTSDWSLFGLHTCSTLSPWTTTDGDSPTIQWIAKASIGYKMVLHDATCTHCSLLQLCNWSGQWAMDQGWTRDPTVILSFRAPEKPRKLGGSTFPSFPMLKTRVRLQFWKIWGLPCFDFYLIPLGNNLKMKVPFQGFTPNDKNYSTPGCLFYQDFKIQKSSTIY